MTEQTLRTQAESLLTVVAGARIDIESGVTDEGEPWFAIVDSCCFSSRYNLAVMDGVVHIFKGFDLLAKSESFDLLHEQLFSVQLNHSKHVTKFD